jgi:hypothetical protein
VHHHRHPVPAGLIEEPASHQHRQRVSAWPFLVPESNRAQTADRGYLALISELGE